MSCNLSPFSTFSFSKGSLVIVITAGIPLKFITFIERFASWWPFALFLVSVISRKCCRSSLCVHLMGSQVPGCILSFCSGCGYSGALVCENATSCPGMTCAFFCRSIIFQYKYEKILSLLPLPPSISSGLCLKL